MTSTGRNGSAAPTEQDLLNELSCYTLAHGDAAFLHQHVVDAWAAQNATPESKPIQIMFALIGLYLHLERGFTGRQVQRAHMQLATPRRNWKLPSLPIERGAIRVADVIAAPPGLDREVMIDVWCMSVWQAWNASHAAIAAIAQRELGI